MGLLDEAIRSHLELKRRSGADPSVVEREVQEALAPGPTEDTLAGLDDWEGEFEYDDDGYDEADELPQAGGEGDSPVAEEEQLSAPSFADLADAGQQDTAELDMQAAMDADPGPAGAAPVAASSGEPPPESIPGQERLSFE